MRKLFHAKISRKHKAVSKCLTLRMEYMEYINLNMHFNFPNISRPYACLVSCFLVGIFLFPKTNFRWNFIFNNYSPKAKNILSNNPRDEVDGIIRQHSLVFV